MTALSTRQKIEKINEATALLQDYTKNIDALFDQGTINDKLASLSPYIDTMNSITPDFETLTPELKQEVQDAVKDLKLSLSRLLKATTQVQNDTINEKKAADKNSRGNMAYAKANNGTGY